MQSDHFTLMLNLSVCADIGGCQQGLCVENADCSDTVGSYECTCSTGYSGDGFVSCESESLPIDMNLLMNLLIQLYDFCVHEVNVVRLTIDKIGASTINECTEGFTCAITKLCALNFSVDIDECQLGLDACVENADCSDTEGSYECTCSTGYSGDGLVNCESKSLIVSFERFYNYKT